MALSFKKWAKISTCFALTAGVSVTGFALDCNSLISKGLQRSVIPAATGVSLADVNTCLTQCDYIQSTGNPTQDTLAATQCVSSLSTLKFAINYTDSNSGLSPNTFVVAPGIAPDSAFGSSHSLPSMTSNAATAPQNVANTYQAVPTLTPQQPSTPSGYVSPAVQKKLNSAVKNNAPIRWY